MKGDTVKSFHLYRKQDVNGISGTGVVGLGVVLPSGRAVLEWTASNHPTITIYQNISEVELIHGHDGATEVIMGLPEDTSKKRKK